MKVILASEHDAYDPNILSGTLFSIAKALSDEDIQIEHLTVTPAQQLLPPLQELFFCIKRLWLKVFKRSDFLPSYYTSRALYIAETLNKQLANSSADIILTALTPITAAFLKTKIPIVYWTDHVYGGLLGFRYSNCVTHDPDTMWDGHTITNASLTNSNLLIFSSNWAARNAVELYGISENRIKVVPFGPNIEITHNQCDVAQMIKTRDKKCIKLVFVGKEWFKKGGDIVLEISQELTSLGHPVAVTIVGCIPKRTLPSYAKCVDFLSKESSSDVTKLKQLYQEAHFLFVPSRAEAFGIVFCEANAFGVPCITTSVGGIPDVVKKGINGMTFSLEATIKEYCDYIINLMENYAEYERLALSSFNEYQTRLNWELAAKQVKKLMTDTINSTYQS